VCIKFCENLGKIVMETLARIRHALKKESMSRQSGQTEKGERREEQSQGLAYHFDIKGILHKEFVLAGQTVNSTYYYDDLWRLHENV
jgi:hypothetical protein